MLVIVIVEKNLILNRKIMLTFEELLVLKTGAALKKMPSLNDLKECKSTESFRNISIF